MSRSRQAPVPYVVHATAHDNPTLFLSHHHDQTPNAVASRQSLKKYVKANNNIKVSDNMFDSLFNKALKSGVEKGVFEQPKGTKPARTPTPISF